MSQVDSSQQEKITELQNDIPVHVVPIAESLGVSVYKNHDFPDTLSGLIKKNHDGKYEIHINGNHPITRQRFTMAHELAHFLLHKDEIGDGIIDDFLYRSGLSSRLEREANDLAAEILMPKHKLLGKPYSEMTISQQADKFWVSHQSMNIRLGRLL